jgi:hypothetical protein
MKNERKRTKSNNRGVGKIQNPAHETSGVRQKPGWNVPTSEFT